MVVVQRRVRGEPGFWSPRVLEGGAKNGGPAARRPSRDQGGSGRPRTPRPSRAERGPKSDCESAPRAKRSSRRRRPGRRANPHRVTPLLTPSPSWSAPVPRGPRRPPHPPEASERSAPPRPSRPPGREAPARAVRRFRWVRGDHPPPELGRAPARSAVPEERPLRIQSWHRDRSSPAATARKTESGARRALAVSPTRRAPARSPRPVPKACRSGYRRGGCGTSRRIRLSAAKTRRAHARERSAMSERASLVSRGPPFEGSAERGSCPRESKSFCGPASRPPDARSESGRNNASSDLDAVSPLRDCGGPAMFHPLHEHHGEERP